MIQYQWVIKLQGIYIELFQHIYLSISSITLAFLLSVPLSYLCYKYNIIEKFSFFVIQVLRIIPSVAVLFILIPILGAGSIPAIVSLTVLAMPSLILNITQGFKNSSLKVKDIPLALGLSESFIFFRIIFPMALSYVFLGIKLALIEIIASAAITTFIGAGGLGSTIYTGLSLNRYDLVLEGSILIAFLSVSSMLIMDFFIKRRKIYD